MPTCPHVREKWFLKEVVEAARQVVPSDPQLRAAPQVLRLLEVVRPLEEV